MSVQDLLESLRHNAPRKETLGHFLETLCHLGEAIGRYQRTAEMAAPSVPTAEKTAFLEAVEVICETTAHQEDLIGHPALQQVSFSLFETGDPDLNKAGWRLFRKFHLDHPRPQPPEPSAGRSSPPSIVAIRGEVESAQVFSLAGSSEPFLILAVKDNGFRMREYRLECADPHLRERLRQAEGHLVTVRGQVVKAPGEVMTVLHVQALEE